MDTKIFCFCRDIEEILGVKTSKAYEIVNQLNQELTSKGMLTMISHYYEKNISLLHSLKYRNNKTTEESQ